MTNLKDNAAVPSRTTVRIPTASGNELEAWLYLPEGDGPHPAVVMAPWHRRDQGRRTRAVRGAVLP